MKRTVIVTVKIRPDFYQLIENGTKKYEVRTESFGDAQAIVFLDAATGRRLGMRRVLGSRQYHREDDERVLELSGISRQDFRDLFPPETNGGSPSLWVARLGQPTGLDDLFEERADEQ